jgi:hypothetical protein
LQPERSSDVVAGRRPLAPHPQSLAPAGASVSATLHEEPGSLTCRFDLGDVRGVRLPAGQGGARADGLWRHTCFEAFLAADGAGGYCEFNFSPAGDWAAYCFDGYRAGMRAAQLAAPPRLAVRRTGAGLTLTAHLALDGLFARGTALRVALAAVLEDERGALSYWALAHPPGRPDFHHAAGFVLAARAP